MNTRWTTAGTLALLLLASQVLVNRDVAAQDAPKAEKAKKYRFVSLTIAGKELGKDDLKGMVLVIKGDHGTVVKDGKEVLTATSKIDMAKKPWTIDLEITSGEEKGKTLKGIMEMKDGTMRVCFKEADRPTEFSSTEQNGQILEVLEEIKGKE
jgi:uncharacterized protein (TIGR03067 family)